MSILQQFKVCPICKRKYSFNPDMGQVWCPKCGPDSIPGTGDIPWKKNKKAIKIR